MSPRLLISVRPGETLGALIRNGRMIWFDFIRTLPNDSLTLPVGSICLARVRKVEPGLQAAFVDLGTGESGLLTAKDARLLAGESAAKRPIEKAVHEGEAVLVQISRAARDGKGPRVTADPTLPGPGGKPVHPRRGDETPLWAEIQDRAKGAQAPAVLWQPPEPDPALRLWGAVPSQPSVIEIDHAPSAAVLRRALKAGGLETELVTCREDAFSVHDLSDELERLFAPVTPLPGGGSLIIEPTSALTAIDVNAGRALKSTTEDTALKVNLEAAREIPRQISLRRLGGAVVIDFLRLKAARHRREVIGALKQELAEFGFDAQATGFSAAGLVELVLPRGTTPLHERWLEPCDACGGTGFTRNTAGTALALLARVASEARRGGIPAFQARAAPRVIAWIDARKEAVARELERFAVTAVSWTAEPDWPPARMDVRPRPTPVSPKRT